MADNKKVVQQLQVLLETMGYEKVNREVKSVRKGMEGVEKQSRATATAQNKVKRTMEGVGKAGLATNKEFAKQAQGLGGLVRAYATVAANVFALSSAFLVLKRAADFDSMMISANSMTKVMGTNVASLARDMQEATGYNISFAESLERTNKALAAGFNPAQFKQLGTLVAKISQTFGGSIEANMNKVTQAILRGRTETLATMGIVIDLEQAYVKYANTIGKTREQLTKYEQQQATLSAFLEESQRQVGDVAQDPNPYDKMLAKLQDVSQEIMTTLSKNIFNPLISFLNESKGVAYALIAVLASIFAKTITPDAAAYAAASKKSIESSIYNLKRLGMARATLAAKTQAYGEKQLQDQRKRDAKSVISWAKAEKAKLAETKKSVAFITTLSNATTEQILNNDAKVKKALATAQGDLTKAINSQGVGRGTTASAKRAYAAGNAENLKASLARAAGSGKNFEASMKGVNLSVDTFAKRTTVAFNSLRAYTSAMKKHASVARLNTINNIESMGVWTGIIKSYREAFRGLQVLDRANNKVAASYIYLATAARVAGTTIAVLGKAINSLIPWMMQMWFIWEIGKSIISKFRTQASKDIQEFNKVIEESREKVENFSKVLGDFQALQARTSLRTTFDSLGKELTFVANATADVVSTLNELSSAIFRLSSISIGEKSLGIRERELDILEQQKTIREELKASGTEGVSQQVRNPGIFGSGALFANMILLNKENREAVALGTEQIKNEDQLKELGDKRVALAERLVEAYGQVAESIKFTDQLRELRGLPGVEESVVGALKRAGTEGSNLAATALADAIQGSIDTPLTELIQKIKDNKDFDPKDVTMAMAIVTYEMEKAVTKTQALANAMRSFSDITIEVSKFTKASDNFYLDKAKVSEQADLLKQLSNNIRTIGADTKGAEAAKSVLMAELAEAFDNQDENYLLKFLGLDKGTTYDEIAARVNTLLETYREAAKTLTLKPLAQEQLKAEQALLKVRLEQRGPIDRQASLAGQISEKAKETLNLEKQVLQAKINIARADLANQNLSDDARTVREAELGILEAQLDVTIERRNEIDSERDSLVKQLELRKNLLNLEIAGLNTQISIANTLEKSSLSWIDQAKYARQAANLRAATNMAQIRAYAQEYNLIIANVNATAGLSELDEQRLANLNEQIKLERAKLDELQLQYAMEQRIRDIRSEEATRSSGEGLNPFVASFDSYIKLIELEYFKMIQASKSAAEKWVEVTTKGLDGSIDKLVDQLTSGEGFDWVPLREAIKESFRTSIGDMVKENLKVLSRGIMAGMSGLTPEEAKNKIAAELVAENPLENASFNAMVQLDTTRNVILGNHTLLLKSLVAKDNGVMPALVNPDDVRITTLQEALSSGTDETVESINKSTAESKAGVKTLFNALSGGFGNILSLVGQGISALISAIVSSNAASSGGSLVGSLMSTAAGSAMSASVNTMPPGARAAATGGVFNNPAMTLIGEGSRSEAVVPLPNNREIPVKMTGGGNTVSVNQNFNFENADASAIPQLRMAAKQIKEETIQALMFEINKGGAVAKTTGRRR